MKNWGKNVYMFIICEQLTGNRIKKSVNRTEKLVKWLFRFGYGLGFGQTEFFG